MYANRIKKSLTKLLGIVALLALSLPGYANIDSVKASQLNLDLETGSTAFGIKGEGLIPLYLKANKAIYTDLEGSYDRQKANLVSTFTIEIDMTRAIGGKTQLTLQEGNIGRS